MTVVPEGSCQRLQHCNRRFQHHLESTPEPPLLQQHLFLKLVQELLLLGVALDDYGLTEVIVNWK